MIETDSRRRSVRRSSTSIGGSIDPLRPDATPETKSQDADTDGEATKSLGVKQGRATDPFIVERVDDLCDHYDMAWKMLLSGQITEDDIRTPANDDAELDVILAAVMHLSRSHLDSPTASPISPQRDVTEPARPSPSPVNANEKAATSGEDGAGPVPANTMESVRSGGDDLPSQLERLFSLYEARALSESEFASAKAELLQRRGRSRSRTQSISENSVLFDESDGTDEDHSPGYRNRALMRDTSKRDDALAEGLSMENMQTTRHGKFVGMSRTFSGLEAGPQLRRVGSSNRSMGR